MLTKDGIWPKSLSTTWLWISLVGFILLYGALGTEPDLDAAILAQTAPAGS